MREAFGVTKVDMLPPNVMVDGLTYVHRTSEISVVTYVLPSTFHHRSRTLPAGTPERVWHCWGLLPITKCEKVDLNSRSARTPQ